MNLYYRFLSKLNIATASDLKEARQIQWEMFEETSERIDNLVMTLRALEQDLSPEQREKVQRALSDEFNSAPVFPYGEDSKNPKPVIYPPRRIK